MPTQSFDDGSTLTWDANTGFTSATAATDFGINVQGANWNPSGANPAAGSWDDVLKFGLSRFIDAKTRPLSPQNTAPVLQRTGTLGGVSTGTAAGIPMAWVWLGIAVLVGMAAFGRNAAG
jgi:hypothetical protein